jgi:hypothetical protein
MSYKANAEVIADVLKKLKQCLVFSKKREQGRSPQRIGHGAWKQIWMTP